MRRCVSYHEVRFVIPGPASSFRVAKAKQYRRVVAAAAKPHFPDGPPDNQVEARLYYFHITQRQFDMDNVTKCVLDALTGIAYSDDQQVRLQASQAYDLTGPLRITGVPLDVVKPLRETNNYLFVRLRYVTEAPPGMAT